jgi:GNAT superfamily N-acetyltransferase
MYEDNISVRLAGLDDLALIHHKELSQEKILQKIRQGEIFLLLVNDQLAGSLWVGFLWDFVPFIDLIYINEAYQKRGLSHSLLGSVEDHLREQGYDVLYSSSQMDEPLPQAWHRHVGFVECGVINGMNEGGVGEVFFRKSL